MSQDVSVAPKERVNIKFKPSTGNVKEEIELPLKLLMLGDFTGQPDDRPVDDRLPVDINKDNFDEVLKSHALKLDLNVPNRLEEDQADSGIQVNLTFNGLRDFEPESLARQVPELAALLKLREALVALRGPLGNVPTFRKTIQNLLESEDSRDRLLLELTGPDVGTAK
ncbi:type VI secretion system contractile sheath small subunit [Methylobacterium komagatae]